MDGPCSKALIKLMTSSVTGAVRHSEENDPVKESTVRRQDLHRITATLIKEQSASHVSQ